MMTFKDSNGSDLGSLVIDEEDIQRLERSSKNAVENIYKHCADVLVQLTEIEYKRTVSNNERSVKNTGAVCKQLELITKLLHPIFKAIFGAEEDLKRFKEQQAQTSSELTDEIIG